MTPGGDDRTLRAAGLWPDHLRALKQGEDDRFRNARPISAATLRQARQHMPDGVPMAWMAGLYRHMPPYIRRGDGSRFQDLDGHWYVDFNLADLSNTVGHGLNPVTRALIEQAQRGLQFLLPDQSAPALAEALATRTGLPQWQFTLSASNANTEIIRIARAYTGRPKLLIFEGHYHGHLGATMVARDDHGTSRPEAMGLLAGDASNTVIVPFNDLMAAERALAHGDIALALIEPALTNCSLVLPAPGYFESLYALTRKAGTLLGLDETHTWQLAYGGLIRAMDLQADLVVLGKGLGSGVPLGAYGMTAELGRYLERHLDVDIAEQRGLAIGGTTFGSPLGLAPALAAVTQVQTQSAYARIEGLGNRLSTGLQHMIDRHGLPWRAFAYGPRSGFCLTPELPYDYTTAAPSVDGPFSAARRLFMANRGVWDAIATAGPQASFAHDEADVDLYLEVAQRFLSAIL